MAAGASSLFSLPGSEARPSASNPPAWTGCRVVAFGDGPAEFPPELPGLAAEPPPERVRLYTPVAMAATTSSAITAITARLTGRRGGRDAGRRGRAAGGQPAAPGYVGGG